MKSTLHKFPVFNVLLVITQPIRSLDLHILHNCDFALWGQYLPISPTFLPLVTIVLTSASIYLAFLDSTYNEIMHFFPFCVWLISISIMASGFIHVVANGRLS